MPTFIMTLIRVQHALRVTRGTTPTVVMWSHVPSVDTGKLWRRPMWQLWLGVTPGTSLITR